jgi:iron-sulfur cluster repair protein YtfE (RIC family)
MGNTFEPYNHKTHGMAHDFSGSVAEIVNMDYRTGEVFKKYNINFCCGGEVSLNDT